MEEIGRRTGKVPKALESEPILWDDLRPYWEAFWRLNSTRQSGMGLNPIMFSEIQSYLQFFEVSRPEYLVKFVKELDEVWLVKMNEKNENGRSRNAHQHNDEGRRSVGRSAAR